MLLVYSFVELHEDETLSIIVVSHKLIIVVLY